MKISTILAASLVCTSALRGQTTTKPDTVAKLGPMTVKADATVPVAPKPIQELTLPAIASTSARQIQETVNLLDTEDAVKYLPSVFLRKRNYGDNQATMATRVWGVSSSARSLIFADGVPLTALIANNNTIGGPRWGLVAPNEIARIDMMYGPFSAAYSGNSMGAVMEITTRMPDRLEGSVEQTQAVQSFSLYGTKKNYGTAQTSASVGDRRGRFAFWASGNYQDSHSQPLGYATGATFPSGTTGGYAETNKLNAAANVLGATGLLHTNMMNAKLKVSFDLTPTIRAAYSVGSWHNDTDATVASYLDKAGAPTYAGNAGFATGYFHLEQQQSAHALSVRSNSKGDWDFEVAATRYRFDKDRQRTPTTATANDTTFAPAGRVAVLNGSGWITLDAKGTWHRGGLSAAHVVTAGVHSDRYTLLNTTFNTPDWRTGDSLSGVFSEGDGKTQTRALWAQDAWRITPAFKLTVGGRWESFRAFDGYNVNGATKINQPTITDTRFSPKAVLSWNAIPEWSVTGSVAKAYRFATASELYQLVTTGSTFTSPNPDLKPDNVLASEVRVERRFARANAQVALFRDDVHDAIISQFKPLVAGSSTLYSYLSNVEHVRARGVEVVLGSRDLVITGVDVTVSATYLDPRTLETSGQGSATATAGDAIGKQLPNIPKWRANFVTTYRPDDRWAISLAGRYSDQLFTTLENTDVRTNTYQGFAPWFVADAHINARINRNWSASLGADNLLNRKYFLFHPFPQRTFIAGVKFGF